MSPLLNPLDRYIRYTTAVLAAAVLGSCAAQQPVLYPNAQLKSVSSATSQRDIEACKARAKQNGADSSQSGHVAGNTAAGATVGGATGAAAGAVYGSAGRHAAAGAAGGATAGFFRGLFSSDKPSPVYRRFVEQCLRDKGYRPIGWN